MQQKISHRLIRFLAGLGLVLSIIIPSASALAADRPNVVLIMTDDQGYGDFSFMGNPIQRTPHIDRLAAGGARLTQFLVSPVCTLTRASLMTGRYHLRTRAIDTYCGRAMMDPQEVTIAEVLRDDGYATGIFGKWHLGDNYPMRAMDQGFTESLVHLGGGLRQPANPREGENYVNPILMHNGQPVQTQGYCTDIYFDAAMAYIGKQHKEGKPFFTYIATNAPHGPYDEPPASRIDEYSALVDNENIASAYAMNANIDDNVGRLMRKLDTLGITDNTLVIFLTDNGPAVTTHNAGLRGRKGSVYDGGIRTVFLAHWPAALQAGHADNRIAAHIDVMPTILDVCGVTPPEGVAFDGQSVAPLLRGERVDWADRAIMFRWHRGNAPTKYHSFAVRTQQWKLVSQGNISRHTLDGEPKFELYKISEDFGETKDLAAKHPDILADYKQRYERWLDDVSHTRPDNYAPPRIVFGTQHQNPILLTQQDMRSDVVNAEGWVRPDGYWAVNFAQAKTVAARVILDKKTQKPATVSLSMNGVEKTIDIAPGQAEVMIKGLAVPAGDGQVTADLKEQGKGRNTIYQIEISW